MNRYYRLGDQFNQYVILKVIGEGRYGIVYLAEDNHRKKYIIKQLKKEELRYTQDKLFYEQEILKLLDDECFPKFIGYFRNQEDRGYILEFKRGNTFEELVRKKGYKYSKLEIYQVGMQLIRIISKLQQQGIVHRDIRMPNVLMDESNKMYLIDFGLARYIGNKYSKEEDYWYLGDFLIHLYYTNFYSYRGYKERPWYKELSLTNRERTFLKRLMGIEREYHDIEEIQQDLAHIMYA